MYSNHSCPRCATPISYERMLGNVVVCSCGWSGNKSQFDAPKRSFHVKKIATYFSFAAILYMGYDAQTWGKHYPERLYYKSISFLKMTDAKDEARMAHVCKELNKHVCAAESYTKALAKSPKTFELAGALGIELSKIGEHDRAILTFQNYFSHADGTDEHKQFFARSLSNKEYISDATEWYYKSLQANAENFDAAKELIKHLTKNELYTEALSVIGHYNLLFPKTRKDWQKLTDDVKNLYSAYTSKYDIKEIKITGINQYLHAPVKFANSKETQLFLVDPTSEFLTVDLKQIQDQGVEFKNLGEKEVMATNGRYIKGTEVILAELNVGPFKLTNVKAIACENCAFLLGKDVMERLHFKTQDNKGIKYITLTQ
jgi:tetratricopeptide (TPR) repeat protein